MCSMHGCLELSASSIPGVSDPHSPLIISSETLTSTCCIHVFQWCEQVLEEALATCNICTLHTLPVSPWHLGIYLGVGPLPNSNSGCWFPTLPPMRRHHAHEQLLTGWSFCVTVPRDTIPGPPCLPGHRREQLLAG